MRSDLRLLNADSRFYITRLRKCCCKSIKHMFYGPFATGSKICGKTVIFGL